MAPDSHGWLYARGRDLLRDAGDDAGSWWFSRAAAHWRVAEARTGVLGASAGDGQAGCSVRSDAGLVLAEGTVMQRLTRRLRRRRAALLLAGVLACAAALAGLIAGSAASAVAAGGCTARY